MNPKKLARKVLPRGAARGVEEAYRKGRVNLLHAAYGQSLKGLKIIAVTGTNGKTTTCSFINEMLKNAGYKTAMFTTAEIEINGQKSANKTSRTVVLTAELFKLLKRASKADVDFTVIEVTSQALHQHKLWGVPVKVAVMTNLSHEHLDYHKTMEEYAAAKARLFNSYTNPELCILNRDDEWFSYFKNEAVGKVLSYGQHKDSSLQISDIKTSADGTSFSTKYDGKKSDVGTNLPGKFNALNAAAAMGAGLSLGLDLEETGRGVQALAAVPGRMERVEAGQPFKVLIDYAVTPDALEQALATVREFTKGKTHLVFGATGDRDKSKRPQMGKVAAKFADRIYLTDDETYTENPEAIRQSVFEGIDEAGAAGKTLVIDDRQDAIKSALENAGPDDTVLLTGIGHQTSRNMGGIKRPWNERETVKDFLRS